MVQAIVGGIMALIAAGTQAGMSASATKRAGRQAEQLENRQTELSEMQRTFSMSEQNKDLKRSKEEFAHQKGIDAVNKKFTIQDINQATKDANKQITQSFSTQLQKKGAEGRLARKERTRFRLESM